MVGLLFLLEACERPLETGKDADQDQVPRPEWRMGDRWVYRRTTPTGGTSVVTYLVTAATADGYTLRLTGLVPEVTETWSRDLHLRAQRIAGREAAEFDPPAMFFSWPLVLGKTWSQRFRFHDGRQDGEFENTWQVGPIVESILVPAGAFYAVRVERRGGSGEALDRYWYTPRARHWVKRESYGAGFVDDLVEGPSGS